MCGIIAIAGNKIEDIPSGAVQNMLASLSRRGPDDRGFARMEKVLLGQTRLSIVDIKGGHQPMGDNHRPFTLVFNGEIYGYKNIRAKLQKLGHSFSTNSDTEVILKSYAEYGRDCVRELDGMFAFALWDAEKEELFIARDRFGKKPFYYTFKNKTFFGTSEIKALFAAGIRGKISSESLDDYLHLSYIPPDKTIYENIHTLPPACAGTVKDGEIKVWQYWKLEKKKLDISYERAKAEIKRLFDDAVKKRMIADVEIGSLLSGGIDSTLVTIYAQKYSKAPIKTFSVGYEGIKNELPFALEVSKKIGTEHHTLGAKSDLTEELKKIAAYMDEPHADSSDFPQAMISGLASSKVKVALSGDGADELFMGYGWYQKHWHTPRWRLSRFFGNPWKAQQKLITVFDDKERQSLLKVKVSAGKIENSGNDAGDPLDKINKFDLCVYLPGQLLTKIDRTSMMHSLEVRSPFLDTALAEFVYSLPVKFKLSGTENKIILKEILAEVFPKDFVYRRKQGFGAPIDAWLRQDKMKKFAENTLRSENDMYKFINKDRVMKILDEFYSKGSDGRKVWSLLSLALWFDSHDKYHE